MHEPGIFIAWRTGWIASLERDPSRGTLRSVDVFIQRTSDTMYSIKDPAERLIIQVLCVECADPRGDGDGAAPTASTSEAGSRSPNSSRLTEN